MIKGNEPFRPGVNWPRGQVVQVGVALELEDADGVRDLKARVSGVSSVTATISVGEAHEEVQEDLRVTDHVTAVITDETGRSREVGLELTHTTDAHLTDETGTGLTPEVEELIALKVQEEITKQGGKILPKDIILGSLSLALGMAIPNLDQVVAVGERVTKIVFNIIIPGGMN